MSNKQLRQAFTDLLNEAMRDFPTEHLLEYYTDILVSIVEEYNADKN